MSPELLCLKALKVKSDHNHRHVGFSFLAWFRLRLMRLRWRFSRTNGWFSINPVLCWSASSHGHVQTLGSWKYVCKLWPSWTEVKFLSRRVKVQASSAACPSALIGSRLAWFRQSFCHVTTSACASEDREASVMTLAALMMMMIMMMVSLLISHTCETVWAQACISAETRCQIPATPAARHQICVFLGILHNQSYGLYLCYTIRLVLRR